MGTIDTALFVTSPSHEHESVQMVDDVVVSLGGKGLISAIAMAHEGVDIAPLALVGRNSRIAGALPDTIRKDWLIEAQAEDSLIWLTIGGVNRVAAFVATGRLSVTDKELEGLASEYAASVDALYLSFDALPLLRGAFAMATRRQVRLAVNINRPLIDMLAAADHSLLHELVARAEVVICNEDESKRALRIFAASTWTDVVDIKTAVVITHGEDGGIIRAPSATEWVKYQAVNAPTVRSVVGAGDTFNGAFLAAYWTRNLAVVESCAPAAALATQCLGLRSSSVLGEL